ncbi:MAG: fibronectin type III domain-containing protein, partial [Ilumatobacteraceae bacterium]
LRVTGIGPTSVGLAWSLPPHDGNSAITDYRIETSRDGGTTWVVHDDGVASMRSRDVTGLVRGTWLRFRVSAVNLAGIGTPSDATESVGVGLPSTPCCLAEVSVGPRRVAIRWGAPTHDGGTPLEGYRIEYSVDAGATWVWANADTIVRGCTSCASIARTITGLADGVPHVFRVRAYTADGAGTWSAASEASTPWTPQVPGVPRALAATARTGVVDLDWEDPTNDGGAQIIDYVIDASTDAGATWSRVADASSAATLASLRGLPTGVAHVFRVAAVNEVGTGAPSAPSESVTPISPLANDPFAGAASLVGDSGTVASSTVTATRETGEPTHGGYRPAASLWWTWTATEAGTLVLSTQGSDYDTLLGVYTGARVDALATVAQNDDAAGETGVWSRVTITPVVGTRYAVAVDGYHGKTGAVRLGWTFTPAPRPEAPGAPRPGRATAGTAAATVYWLAPTSDGNAPITTYTVTADPGGRSCTTTGALTCQVRNLLNGTAYAFTVTATNSAGTSAASSPSDPVTPSAHA